MVWVAIVTPELYLSAPETFCALFQLLDILSVREGIYILARRNVEKIGLCEKYSPRLCYSLQSIAWKRILGLFV